MIPPPPSSTRTSTLFPYPTVFRSLALVKELVELMGRTIDVESQPGAGTTFRVLIPVEAAVAGRAFPEVDPVTDLDKVQPGENMGAGGMVGTGEEDRKSTSLNSSH